jgi:hypothetical protein
MVAGADGAGWGIVQGAISDPARQQATTEDERQWQRQYMTNDVSLLRPIVDQAQTAEARRRGGGKAADQKRAVGGAPLLMRLPHEGSESTLERTHVVAKQAAKKAEEKDWGRWEKDKQEKAAAEKAAKAQAAKKSEAADETLSSLKEANEAKGDEWVRSLDDDRAEAQAQRKRRAKKSGGKGGGPSPDPNSYRRPMHRCDTA